jgi:hypothetical protein
MRLVLRRHRQADRRACAKKQHELTAHFRQVIGISAQLFSRSLSVWPTSSLVLCTRYVRGRSLSSISSLANTRTVASSRLDLSASRRSSSNELVHPVFWMILGWVSSVIRAFIRAYSADGNAGCACRGIWNTSCVTTRERALQRRRLG